MLNYYHLQDGSIVTYSDYENDSRTVTASNRTNVFTAYMLKEDDITQNLSVYAVFKRADGKTATNKSILYTEDEVLTNPVDSSEETFVKYERELESFEIGINGTLEVNLYVVYDDETSQSSTIENFVVENANTNDSDPIESDDFTELSANIAAKANVVDTGLAEDLGDYHTDGQSMAADIVDLGGRIVANEYDITAIKTEQTTQNASITTAQETADTAQETAEAAQTAADTVVATAEEALTNSEEAVTTADAASTKVDGLEDDVEDLKDAAYKDKGVYSTEADLLAAYPTGEAGWSAVVGTDSLTIWQWNVTTEAWEDSGLTPAYEQSDLSTTDTTDSSYVKNKSGDYIQYDDDTTVNEKILEVSEELTSSETPTIENTSPTYQAGSGDNNDYGSSILDGIVSDFTLYGKTAPNLIDVDGFELGTISTADGSESSSTEQIRSDYMAVTASEVHDIFLKNSDYEILLIEYSDNAGTFVAYQDYATETVFTANASTTYVRIVIQLAAGGTITTDEAETAQPLLFNLTDMGDDSFDNAYSSYSADEVNSSFPNYFDGTATTPDSNKITSYGSNWFDINSDNYYAPPSISSAIDDSNNLTITNTTAATINTYLRYIYYNFLAGKTYKISCDWDVNIDGGAAAYVGIFYNDGSTSFLDSLTTSGGSTTFTVPDGATEMRFYFYNSGSSGVAGSTTFSNIRICLGDTATSTADDYQEPTTIYADSLGKVANVMAYQGGTIEITPYLHKAYDYGDSSLVLDDDDEIKAIDKIEDSSGTELDSADYSLDITGLIITISGATTNDSYFVFGELANSIPPDSSGVYATSLAKQREADNAAILENIKDIQDNKEKAEVLTSEMEETKTNVETLQTNNTGTNTGDQDLSDYATEAYANALTIPSSSAVLVMQPNYTYIKFRATCDTTYTAYDSGTTYAVDDLVSYDGYVYKCILEATGQQPDTATTYWTVQDLGECVPFLYGTDNTFYVNCGNDTTTKTITIGYSIAPVKKYFYFDTAGDYLITIIGDCNSLNFNTATVTTTESDKFIEIHYGSNVTNYGDYAARSCANLKVLNVDNMLTSITTLPTYFGNGCDSLSEFVIPEHITAIGASLLYGSDGIRKIIIPDAVTSIGNDCFSSSLQTIEIPHKTTEITFGATTFNNVKLIDIIITRGATQTEAEAIETAMETAGLETPYTNYRLLY